jgi:hypothetical protein
VHYLLPLLALAGLLVILVAYTLTATNLYINWTACTFTPSGGSAQTLFKITDVKIAKGGSPEKFKGDLAVYAIAVAVPDRTRTITVSTGDIVSALALVQGTVGAFSVTLADAINGIVTAGGGKTYALTNCIVVSNNADAAHAKFGNAQIVFEGFAPDGTTEPLTATSV